MFHFPQNILSNTDRCFILVSLDLTEPKRNKPKLPKHFGWFRFVLVRFGRRLSHNILELSIYHASLNIADSDMTGHGLGLYSLPAQPIFGPAYSKPNPELHSYCLMMHGNIMHCWRQKLPAVQNAKPDSNFRDSMVHRIST